MILDNLIDISMANFLICKMGTIILASDAYVKTKNKISPYSCSKVPGVHSTIISGDCYVGEHDNEIQPQRHEVTCPRLHILHNDFVCYPPTHMVPDWERLFRTKQCFSHRQGTAKKPNQNVIHWCQAFTTHSTSTFSWHGTGMSWAHQTQSVPKPYIGSLGHELFSILLFAWTSKMCQRDWFLCHDYLQLE